MESEVNFAQCEEMWRFVESHLKEDPAALRLKFAGKHPWLDTALVQIEGRRKCAAKLRATLEANPRFLFPLAVSAEQATDERVAAYHASFFRRGERVLDLTAGLGIDASHIAAAGAQLTAVEMNPAILSAFRHNFPAIPALHGDSIEILKGIPPVDTMFADPARRDGSGARTYALSDCSPDIAASLDIILDRCSRLIVKASPMLDPVQVVRELRHVSAVRAVSLKGECKELLIEVSADAAEPVFEAVDIDGDGRIRTFRITPADVDVSARTGADTFRYIYEPGAAVMKFDSRASLLAAFPDVRRADASTSLYLSDTLYADFPGRVTRVVRQVSAKDRSLKGERLNVVSRNHPMRPEEIARRLGTRDGGSDFLYAFRLASPSGRQSRPVLYLTTPV